MGGVRRRYPYGWSKLDGRSKGRGPRAAGQRRVVKRRWSKAGGQRSRAGNQPGCLSVSLSLSVPLSPYLTHSLSLTLFHSGPESTMTPCAARGTEGAWGGEAASQPARAQGERREPAVLPSCLPAFLSACFSHSPSLSPSLSRCVRVSGWVIEEGGEEIR